MLENHRNFIEAFESRPLGQSRQIIQNIRSALEQENNKKVNQKYSSHKVKSCVSFCFITRFFFVQIFNPLDPFFWNKLMLAKQASWICIHISCNFSWQKNPGRWYAHTEQERIGFTSNQENTKKIKKSQIYNHRVAKCKILFMEQTIKLNFSTLYEYNLIKLSNIFIWIYLQYP